MTDDAQPVEGQGSEAGGSPYDSYLETVPAEAREAAETWFRDTSKGLDQKLAEAASLKKTWGPYEPTKDLLQNYTPDDLSQLVEWHQQVTASPETYREWLQAQYEEQGLTPQDAADAADVEMDQEPDDVSRFEQMLQERLNPLQEGLTAVQTERGTEVEENAIRTELGRLEDEAGLKLTDEQRTMVIKLGEPAWVNERGEELPAGDASWVEYGFGQFREITNMGAKLFVEQKSQQPASAITTGGSAAQAPITDFKSAGDALRERLKNAQ